MQNYLDYQVDKERESLGKSKGLSSSRKKSKGKAGVEGYFDEEAVESKERVYLEKRTTEGKNNLKLTKSNLSLNDYAQDKDHPGYRERIAEYNKAIRQSEKNRKPNLVIYT